MTPFLPQRPCPSGQDPCYEETADDEENVDADKAAGQPGKPQVVAQDEADREAAQAFYLFTVGRNRQSRLQDE